MDNYTVGDYWVEYGCEEFNIRGLEGEYIMTVQHSGIAPEKLVRDLIRAYERGVEVGEKAGAYIARRNIRVALGIE